MAGSPPNFHKMDYRSACIQDVLKVKVKVKGHVIRALGFLEWATPSLTVWYLVVVMHIINIQNATNRFCSPVCKADTKLAVWVGVTLYDAKSWQNGITVWFHSMIRILSTACVIGFITSIHSPRNAKSWLLSFGNWRRFMVNGLTLKTYQPRYLWVLMCTYESSTLKIYLSTST